jgi:hypothetical protein
MFSPIVEVEDIVKEYQNVSQQYHKFESDKKLKNQTYRSQI